MPKSLLCALVATLLCTGVADAATVELSSKTVNGSPGPDVVVTTVTVTAVAGETNAVTGTSVAPGERVVFVDPAAPLTAGPGCTQTAVQTVECPYPNRITAELGNENDFFDIGTLTSPTAKLSGGTGNDTLVAGGGGDDLNGGGGQDTLRGGAGDDTIADEDGATGDADVLDGDEGADTLDLADHSGGVTLDLAAGTSTDGDTVSSFATIRLGSGRDEVTGSTAPESVTDDFDTPNRITGGGGADTLAAAGELLGDGGNDTIYCRSTVACRATGGSGRDQISGSMVDDVIDGSGGNDELSGFQGDDLLRGGAGNDVLSGDILPLTDEDGDDVLRGGFGNDTLRGSGGVDALFGAAGADRLDAVDTVRDSINCGSGQDRLSRDRRDRAVVRTCERIRLGS